MKDNKLIFITIVAIALACWTKNSAKEYAQSREPAAADIKVQKDVKIESTPIKNRISYLKGE